MRTVAVCLVGAVGTVVIAVGSPAPADSLKSVVRTLNAIINPEDAWRLEDQAGRYDRPTKSAIGAMTVPGSSSSAASAAKRCCPIVNGANIRPR